MEIIPAKKIREILRKQYPKLKHIWIFKRKLVLLPPEKVSEILRSITTYKNKFKKGSFECEDFSIVAHSEVKIKIAALDLPFSWAFGHASMVYPKRGVHNKNIFITEDYGIRLFEPQTNITVRPNNETVFFMEI